MKKNVKLILVFLLLTISVGVIGYKIFENYHQKEESGTIDEQRFKKEYESLNDTMRNIKIPTKNLITYSTAEEIAQKIQSKESFVVYFGFAKCPWCRSMVPYMIDIAKEYDIETLYYVDVLNIRDTLEIINGEVTTTKEGTEGYQKLLPLLDNVLEKYILKDSDGNSYDTNEKRIYAPNVVTVVNGEPLRLITGISALQTDSNMKLTDDIVLEMKSQINEIFMEFTKLTRETCNSQSKC